MRQGGLILIFFMALGFLSHAQTNIALNMSEVMAYNARFNPSDLRQSEIIATLKPVFLIEHLKTDQEKLAFWINVYNSQMLNFLRDTANQGVYTTFYKQKNTRVAGKAFSLFDIEHEFIRLGVKNKALGFKKSILKKDTLWCKLRPAQFDFRAIFIMYKGMYGYPPFQCIENANLESSYSNSMQSFKNQCLEPVNDPIIYFDWVTKYKITTLNTTAAKPLLTLIYTPFAVYIHNYYPKYEGVRFKIEEKNPWAK